VVIGLKNNQKRSLPLRLSRYAFPYTTAGVKQKTWGVEDWNYVFEASCPTEREGTGIELIKKMVGPELASVILLVADMVALLEEVGKYGRVVTELGKRMTMTLSLCTTESHSQQTVKRVRPVRPW
jgi:hypothetical protein